MYYLTLFFTSFLLIASSACHAEAREVALEELSSRYEAFLLDAHGVFWGSSAVGLLPGAAAAMKYLVSEGKCVGIVTNSTQLGAKEKEKLRRYGLYEGVHYHFLVTAADAARELLLAKALPFATPRCKYWLFGAPHPHFGSHLPIFEGTGYVETKELSEADFVHISIPHIEGVDQEDPEVFRKWVEAVGTGVEVLCVSPDRFALEGSPPSPVVRQGSIAEMFVERKIPVHMVGKPSSIIYETALRQVPRHIPKEKILMIGDTPGTDIRGAHGVGLDAALITKTGVVAELLEKEGIASCLDRLALDDQPDFLLERLAK